MFNEKGDGVPSELLKIILAVVVLLTMAAIVLILFVGGGGRILDMIKSALRVG